MNSMKPCVLMEVFAMSFLFAAVAPGDDSPATGPLRVCRDNPRYFADGSGKAIYLTGAHSWSDLKDVGNSDPAPHRRSGHRSSSCRHPEKGRA